MRLAVGTLALLLAHSIAVAEDATPVRSTSAGGAGGELVTKLSEAPSPAPARSKVPIRVVRILRETNQALLFDRTGTGTHVLVAVGDKVGIYTVDSIDDDEVTLSANDKQIVLAAPERPWRRRNAGTRASGEPAGEDARDAIDRGPAEKPAARGGELVDPYQTPSPGAPAPADPYQTPGAGASAPADPYEAPSAGGPAPADPYAQELREVKAPSWVEPIAPAPAPVTTTPPSPTPAVAPAPTSPIAADPVLTRREVDAALADFGSLSVAFRATLTPAGAKVDSILEGSLFSKAGLRAGDVIASVDGKPLRTLDDVATLYARAGSLRTVTAQVVRGGKPLTLRAVIQ